MIFYFNLINNFKDQKWIDVILGKDDAVRMRDCGKIIKDDSKSEIDKQQAYDELEMVRLFGNTLCLPWLTCLAGWTNW